MGLRYFAYGSNMHPGQLTAWAPDARRLGPARLDDYRLDFRRRSLRWGAGVADVVEAPGEAVWGVLYELPETDLRALDAKEGVALGFYRRIDVTVHHEARPLGAVAYEVIEKTRAPVAPSPGYSAILLAAAAASRLPAAYVDAIHASVTGLAATEKPHPA